MVLKETEFSEEDKAHGHRKWRDLVEHLQYVFGRDILTRWVYRDTYYGNIYLIDTEDCPQRDEKEELLWWQKENLSFTGSGYGSKIPTVHMVQYKNRWMRVYCRIFSNSGTLFIGKDIRSGIIVTDIS